MAGIYSTLIPKPMTRSFPVFGSYPSDGTNSAVRTAICVRCSQMDNLARLQLLMMEKFTD